MSITFSNRELIRIAIGIEQRGIIFYDVIARSTDNTRLKEIFEHLVNMERDHIKIFQSMIEKADADQPSPINNEYSGYLQALIDNAVFTDESITSEMATNAENDAQALELGLNAEKDSILFYYSLKELFPDTSHSVINKIIEEEKSHLEQLSELKKQLEA